MRKIIALLLSLCLVSVSCSKNNSKSARIEGLNQKIAELESLVAENQKKIDEKSLETGSRNKLILDNDLLQSRVERLKEAKAQLESH